MFTAGDYEIYFDYYQYDPPMKVGETAWASDSTFCEIYCISGEYSVVDVAYCSTNDEYNTQYGEELALDRAIKKLTSDEDLKQSIWEAYDEWLLEETE